MILRLRSFVFGGVLAALSLCGCSDPSDDSGRTENMQRRGGDEDRVDAYLVAHSEILAQYPKHVASKAVFVNLLREIDADNLTGAAETLLQTRPDSDAALCALSYLLEETMEAEARRELSERIRRDFANSPLSLMAFDGMLGDAQALAPEAFVDHCTQLLNKGIKKEEAFVVRYRRAIFFRDRYMIGRASTEYLRVIQLDPAKAEKLHVPEVLTATLKSAGWLLEARSLLTAVNKAAFATGLLADIPRSLGGLSEGVAFLDAYFDPNGQVSPDALANLLEGLASNEPIQLARVACSYAWHGEQEPSLRIALQFSAASEAKWREGKSDVDYLKKLGYAVEGMLAEQTFQSDGSRVLGAKNPGELELSRLSTDEFTTLRSLINTGIEMACASVPEGPERVKVLSAMASRRSAILIAMKDKKTPVQLWEYCIGHALDGEESAHYLFRLAKFYKEDMEEGAKAVEVYKRLIAAVPGSPMVEEALIKVILAHFDLAQHDAAYDHAEQYLSAYPEGRLRDTVLFLRSISMVNLDYSEASRDILYQLTVDYPQNALASKGLLWLIRRQVAEGEFVDALELARDLLSRFPETQEAKPTAALAEQLKKLV